MAICNVSGVVQDVSGTAIAGAIIRSRIITPFFSGTIQILPTEPTTQTTDAGGAWSQTLIQGANVELTVQYPPNSLDSQIRLVYSIVVPATSTATFSSLVTES